MTGYIGFGLELEIQVGTPVGEEEMRFMDDFPSQLRDVKCHGAVLKSGKDGGMDRRSAYQRIHGRRHSS